ncbi:Trihelix transcription factor PTL [Abeliophyllum distichum]|uniref:Trihelix transcription factor PTL n=1 Tax=Abeliophyllum distichum TaxID=126358 RepID=A0ABD1QYH8_9LAMI
MEDQYGMADLRQCINGRTLFPPISQPPDLLSGHSGLSPAQHYEMLMLPRGLQQEFLSDSTTSASFNISKSASTGGASSIGAGLGGFDMEAGGLNVGSGGDIGTGRWPRQETLTLLEIRSRLDPKFKEANQKGPLWDEVSRIMSEEHGYQRSGKKCREKFENLYKYYKKTKEGKAGRQDGKHYRFFRQLEALYGETNNGASVSETHVVGSSFQYKTPHAVPNQETYPAPKISDYSLSLSNSSDFDTTSSDNSDLNEGKDDNSTNKRKKTRGQKCWKAKIRDFIDAQMRKLMDKQEDWMEKMMRTIEHKEQERILREEEWRKQDAERIEREQKFWANERAWIEGRDAALMEALQKLGGKELMAADIGSLSENPNDDPSETITINAVKGDNIWPDREITRLFQLRATMEERSQQGGVSEEVIWEEIARKMACFGHDRSGLTCKEKWYNVNNYLIGCNNKRRENPKGCSYYQNNESICNERDADHTSRLNDNGINDFCFRYFMGDADNNVWENYALKLNKG